MTDDPTPIPPDEFERRDIARARILAALQLAPRDSADLNAICYRYSARIMELRRDGWPIRAKRAVGSRLWRYELTGPQGPAPTLELRYASVSCTPTDRRGVGGGWSDDPDLFA